MNKKLTIRNLIVASVASLATVPAFAGRHAMGSPGDKYIRVPHLFKANLDGDKLVVGEEYKP